MTDLSALIARLEAAEVGSRELDAAVCDALNWRKTDGVWVFPAPVSQSLDAALALAERVLGEDQALEILADEARAALEDTINGSLKRVPIDVCINAILRAKQGEG